MTDIKREIDLLINEIRNAMYDLTDPRNDGYSKEFFVHEVAEIRQQLVRIDTLIMEIDELLKTNERSTSV